MEERGEGEQLHMLIKRIDILQQLAHENQVEMAKKQRAFHDAHAEAHTFKEGDKVRLYRKTSTTGGVTSKLAYHWTGPYTIAKVLGPVTYTITDANGKPYPGTVHARQLYKDPEDN